MRLPSDFTPPTDPGRTVAQILLGHAVGAGASAATVAALVLLSSAMHDRPMMIVLMAPIMAAAWMGGLCVGLSATAVAALGSNMWLLAPHGQWSVANGADLACSGSLLVCGALASIALEGVARARRRDRRTLLALRETERRLRDSTREADELRAALDAHAIVSVSDAKGAILFVNDKFCALSGYSREELLGHDHRILNAGHHPREFYEEMWATILAGKTWRGEIRNRAKDGADFWTEATIAPALDAEGRPIRFISIKTDITARKRAEEILLRRNAELQALFDLNPAMIWFKDTRNNHLRVNRRAAEAAGRGVAEIEGRPAAEVYPAEAERFYADDLEVIRSRRPKFGIVETIRDAQGRTLWVQTDKVPCLDAQGRVTGIIVSAQDITARREAEEALRRSEERFRQLAENINEVFWVADPNENRLLYVSPAFRTIWGRDPDELCHEPEHWMRGVHTDDRDRVRAAKLAQRHDGDYDETYRVVRPDGQERWVRDRGFPVRDDSGKIYRLVGTAQDITEQRRLQAQLFQAQKMEAIGTLAGGIAHDFNNILGGILGYAELARMRVAGNAPARECLDAVIAASRRAADLVRQILAFSRRQEQRPVAVQLRHLVAESMKLLRATLPSTIAFDVDLARDAEAVRADPTQIHQVVLNLCTNAAQAMAGGPGRLTVKLENRFVDEARAERLPPLRPGPHVVLSVSDTGCGMTGATLDRIFEPFFTTKGPGEGTGLGLAVVHGVMQSHDGAVSVRSAPGRGTCFELYFPARPAPAETVPDPAGQRVPAGRGEHILLVDDEPGLAQLGREILETLGYRVTSCVRAEEALARLRAGPDAFELLVTDLVMPEMTGADLARAAHRVRGDLPVLLVTGYAADLNAEQMRESGFGEVLVKPFSVQSLGRAVHDALHAAPAR